MKKLINSNKFNILFLIIPFIIFCIKNITLDNDVWFLLNHGRFVLENGFTYIEPFTIHSGLEFVMQQWLSSLIFWVIYNYLGKKVFMIFLAIVGFFIIFSFYKLCHLVSSNKNISILLSIILSFCLRNYIISRPQIFTYLLLILELYFLELYTKTSDIKKLFILPFLSLIQINMHASMWLFHLLFIFPFILNGIKIKQIKLSNYSIKPLCIVAIVMILVAFINPYGYKSLIYIFNSYGVSEVSEYIREMHPLDFSIYWCKIILMCLFFMIFILNFSKKTKLELRHLFLFFGTIIIAFMQVKGVPYFFIIYLYILSYYLKNIKLNKIKNLNKFKNKYFFVFLNSTKMGVYLMLICTLFYVVINCFMEIKYTNYIEDSVKVILEDADVSDIKLYVRYENGGYTEFMGIKSYIDPRAEVFLKSINKKEDIFIEYYNLLNDADFNYKNFIEKYKFTHFLVTPDEGIDKYLSENDNYELIYEDTDEEFVGVIARVYKTVSEEKDE